MDKKTVHDVEIQGKRVLMRVDFNVPLDGDKVSDDTRIEAALPTIRYILERNPRSLVLMSHLGRPKGSPDPQYSLAPVAKRLSDLLGAQVAFAGDMSPDEVAEAVENLPEGSVMLLENTRFNAGETKNDESFAKELAQYGDLFVNDAFGTAHRAHASNVGVSSQLPAVAGLLMQKEINYLSQTLENPEHPFIAILGGAKVSDKIDVIEALLDKADHILIGGGMANTFFKAQGHQIGDSLVEEEAVDTAKTLLSKGGDTIVLPQDVIIADDFSNDAQFKTVNIEEGVESGWRILDIGTKTVGIYKQYLETAKVVAWNGPMGVFEMSNFAEGTFAMAQALADATENGTVTIIGGGDSASAAEKSGLADKMTHISTGGGASLELMEGKELPGLMALQDR